MITIEQIRAALPTHLLIQARPKDLEYIASKLNADHLPDAGKMAETPAKQSSVVTDRGLIELIESKGGTINHMGSEGDYYRIDFSLDGAKHALYANTITEAIHLATQKFATLTMAYTGPPAEVIPIPLAKGEPGWRYFTNYIDGCIRVSDETCKCQRFVDGSWQTIQYEQARLYASSVRFSEVDPKRGWAKIDASEAGEAHKPDRYFLGDLGLIYRLGQNGDFHCKNPFDDKWRPAAKAFGTYKDLTEITKAEAGEVEGE